MKQSALNLRKFDPKLRQELHAEAKARGTGLTEYCSEILANRQQIRRDVILPGPPVMKSTEPLKDARGVPVILDDWTEPAALQPAAVLEPPKPKPESCPHGWFNRSLCPNCNLR